MKEIIAMHGWAGDSNQWSDWRKIFKCCDWKWQSAERGYKHKCPNNPKWIHDSNEDKIMRVAICHSLGIHLINKHVLHSATHVVLINSFSRFIPSGKQNRIIKMALNRMMNAIYTFDEKDMLRKFHIKANKPNCLNLASQESDLINLSDEGRLRLKNDLILLINSDCLPNGLNTNAKVLIINSKYDYILADQTKAKLAEDLISHLESAPKTINLNEDGHFISKITSIKKIKHWLEFDYAKTMV